MPSYYLKETYMFTYDAIWSTSHFLASRVYNGRTYLMAKVAIKQLYSSQLLLMF